MITIQLAQAVVGRPMGDMVLTVVIAAFSGGLVVRLLERLWSSKDTTRTQSVELRREQLASDAAIREELREVEQKLRDELRTVEREEATWRTKYWEAMGAKAALESELHTMRPRFIDMIQQNQRLLAENETYKYRLGRRATDRQIDAEEFEHSASQTLARIEQAGDKAAAAAEKVATELEGSQERADAILGDPGEAADAASKSRPAG